jgi:RHS repeat-associated protein
MKYDYVAGQGAAREHALSSITYPGGSQSNFEYDTQGRITRTFLGTSDEPKEKVLYGYGPGAELTVTDAEGAVTTYLCNDQLEVAKMIDPFKRTILFAQDASGQIVGTSVPGFGSTSASYDSNGNLTRLADPLGNRIGLQYDLNFNQLTSLEDALGNVTANSLDGRGNISLSTYPDGTTERFTYDDQGNVVRTVNRRNQTIDYKVDTRGLVTRKELPDGSHTDYTYDVHGNLLTATDSHGTIAIEYDAANRLTRIAYPGGRSLEFTYDAAGHRTRAIDQSGFAINYRYDSATRLVETTDGLGHRIVAYQYDAVGRLSREDRGNGTSTTYEYDLAGQLLHLVHRAPDDSVIERFDYMYDAIGRVTSMTTLAGTTAYGYDATGQLTLVTLPGGRSITYEYDAMGNRVLTSDDGITTNYATNSLNAYTTAGGATFAYDQGGNLISRTQGGETTIYEYDAEGRLVGVVSPSGTWSYEYDALGNRTAVVHDGARTEYLIDPTGLADIVAEYDAGGLVAHYTQGLGLTSRVSAAGAAAYYQYDATGNTAALTGPNGTLANSYSYLPFGEALSVTETIPNSFEFVGRFGVMKDAEGLDFMRARFYSAADGRFTQPDRIGLAGGLNLYAYVGNNPVTFADPTGRRTVSTYVSGMITAYLFGGLPGIASYDVVAFAELIPADRPTAPPPTSPAPPTPPTQPLSFPPPPTTGIPPAFPAPPTTGIPPTLAKPPNSPKGPKRPPKLPPNPYCRCGPTPPVMGGGGGGALLSARDPNDLTGPAGFEAQRFVAPDQTLAYTVHFENRATAGAAAQEVVITEQLDPHLDFATFELGDIGFGDVTIHVPSGRRTFNTRVDARASVGLFVDVTADIDLRRGVVTWRFTSVDPTTFDLPSDVLAGFLPPNVTAPQGEGFVSYRVRAKSPATTGTEIRSVASIVFDTNEPIATNQVNPDDPRQGTDPAKEALVTIDAGTPTSRVEALPLSEMSIAFPVAWTGQDEDGGSGVATFDVYVSTDRGPFALWLHETFATGATFTGVDGHSYGFFSVATDNVGHRGATPTSAQATTRVVASSGTSTTVQSSAASSIYGDALTFTATVSANDPDLDTLAGTVQFLVDGNSFGSPVHLVDGVATSFSIATLGAGSHAIAASYSGDATHSASNGSTSQTVGRATLTITADDFTRAYGGSNPTFTVRYSGFVNGDTPSSLTSPAVASTPATSSSPAGRYAINVGGGASPDYAITFRPGTLTVLAPTTTVLQKATLQTVKIGRKKAPAVALTFSHDLDPGSAQSLASYALTTAGRDKKFGTKDDKRAGLRSAAYDAATRTVKLVLKAAPTAKKPNRLRLVAATLKDAFGLALDGDRDGQPGGDALVVLSPKSVTIATRQSQGIVSPAVLDLILLDHRWQWSEAARQPHSKR